MYTPKRHGSVALSAILLGLGMLVHSQNTYAGRVIREIDSNAPEYGQFVDALKAYCPSLPKKFPKNSCIGDPDCNPCLKAVHRMENEDGHPIVFETTDDQKLKISAPDIYTGGRVYVTVVFEIKKRKYSVKKIICSSSYHDETDNWDETWEY